MITNLWALMCVPSSLPHPSSSPGRLEAGVVSSPLLAGSCWGYRTWQPHLKPGMSCLSSIMNKESQASPNPRCVSVLPQGRRHFQSAFGFRPVAPAGCSRERRFQGDLPLSPEERRTPFLGGHPSICQLCQWPSNLGARTSPSAHWSKHWDAVMEMSFLERKIFPNEPPGMKLSYR